MISVVEWIPVDDSDRVVAVAYDAEAEVICVRFPKDVEWCYEACPPRVWEDFMAPGVSKGTFIREVLDHQPHHRYEG